MLQRSSTGEGIGAFGRPRLQPTCGLIVCISCQECCQDLKQAVHVNRVTTDYPSARNVAQVCLQDVICELMQDSFNVICSLLFSARVSLDALNLSAQEGLTASHKKRGAASNLDREEDVEYTPQEYSRKTRKVSTWRGLQGRLRDPAT